MLFEYEQRVKALSWSAFAITALLVLRVPFTGDQYFFALGAEALARGGRLYVDFWDIKQPGIFYIYRLAAALPVDVELAVRIVEIGCWALACELARQILVRDGVDRTVAALTPAALGATYFGAAPAWHLSQVESFVILPLMFCAWCATRSLSRRLDWILLGIGTGVIAWLKLILVLMPAVLALMMLWRTWFEHADRRPVREVCMRIAAAAVAFSLTLALLLTPFWSREAFATLFEVTYHYPTKEMWDVHAAPISRLIGALGWFAVITAPMTLLACAALRSWHNSATVRVLTALLVAAVACIALQRFSWWAYHTTLLRPAIVLLALFAASAVAIPFGRLRPFVIALVSIAMSVVLCLLPTLSRKMSLLPDSFVALRPSAHWDRIEPGRYELLREQAQWVVHAYGRGASLCVLGNPTLAFHASANCEMTIRTWTAAYLSARMWRQFATELRIAKPDLIYLAGPGRAAGAEVLRLQQPAVIEWIDREYRVLRPGMARDTWYIRRTANSRS